MPAHADLGTSDRLFGAVQVVLREEQYLSCFGKDSEKIPNRQSRRERSSRSRSSVCKSPRVGKSAVRGGLCHLFDSGI